eukprot:CAMPEP_0171096852 /NCGR_PEP_ID=MMETSP0766_2-20121228/46119_1 /TAXON_ID=439317 /ORGANISM="Gambierdiscus australes, Strain CAWD 149" /LENGTH=115 /DNA_ID=CAMNT_0011555927 /DNA_START=117 /DNA_END=464 /DNA_ORIENTATION=-
MSIRGITCCHLSQINAAHCAQGSAQPVHAPPAACSPSRTVKIEEVTRWLFRYSHQPRRPRTTPMPKMPLKTQAVSNVPGRQTFCMAARDASFCTSEAASPHSEAAVYASKNALNA